MSNLTNTPNPPTPPTTKPISVCADATVHVPLDSRVQAHGIIELPLTTGDATDPDSPRIQLKCWVCIEVYDPVADEHYELTLDQVHNLYGVHLDLEGRTAVDLMTDPLTPRPC